MSQKRRKRNSLIYYSIVSLRIQVPVYQPKPAFEMI
jgi:hypothetical protein